MRVINASGDPITFGRAYGSQAKDLIQNTTQSYIRLLRVMGLKKEETSAAIDKFEANLTKHAPNLMQELTGMAEGADVSVRDLILLNARSELITLSGAW